MCIETYDLDPCYFVSVPGLAWEACLKKTEQELELLTDMNMLLLFEKGIRGGITQAVHKYATSNNKYRSDYDKNKQSNYLMYLDANSLYGTAMMKHLPISNFKWLKPDTFTEESIKNIDLCGKHGYLFEVDIKYPKELHKLHRDLPFLAESKIINKSKKLVTTCEDKKNYVVHITALQQALKHGLILEKIHKAIQFEQKE